MIRDPLVYLREIADWTGRNESTPMTWGHVLLGSLDVAMAKSPYGKEPLLRMLRDELRERALDRLRHAPDPDLPGLSDDSLVEAASLLIDYEIGRPILSEPQDRFLRWLSDRPTVLDDWTLRVWRRLLSEMHIGPGHFEGRKAWSPAPRHEVDEIPDEHWSAKLENLVGLSSVKHHVEQVGYFLKAEQQRRALGCPPNPFSLHSVFLGAPGTGKTTVARVLGEVYREFGFLEKGHFVEVDRSDLVGAHVGETEANTSAVIKGAIGGVLFIDEAYSLAGGGENDFGKRAIDVLNRDMEEYRHNMAVIVAGYEHEMEGFFRSNRGLRDRFGTTMHFANYDDDELMEIFRRMAEARQFTVTDATFDAARNYVIKMRSCRRDEFGNARAVRQMWEAALRRQGSRLGSENIGDNIDMLTQIIASDIPGIHDVADDKINHHQTKLKKGK